MIPPPPGWTPHPPGSGSPGPAIEMNQFLPPPPLFQPLGFLLLIWGFQLGAFSISFFLLQRSFYTLGQYLETAKASASDEGPSSCLFGLAFCSRHRIRHWHILATFAQEVFTRTSNFVAEPARPLGNLAPRHRPVGRSDISLPVACLGNKIRRKSVFSFEGIGFAFHSFPTTECIVYLELFLSVCFTGLSIQTCKVMCGRTL